MRWLTVLTMMTVVSAASAAHAQAAPAAAPASAVFSNTPFQLDSETMMRERGKKLLERALKSPDGSANDILNRYNGFFTMLVVRTRPGQVELHTNLDDFFFIMDGEMTETIGDAVLDGKQSGPGEIRGTKMSGGRPTVLHKGDVFHIAAGIPHQTSVAPGKTVLYFMVKPETRK